MAGAEPAAASLREREHLRGSSRHLGETQSHKGLQPDPGKVSGTPIFPLHVTLLHRRRRPSVSHLRFFLRSLEPWYRSLLSAGRTSLSQDCSDRQGLPQQPVSTHPWGRASSDGRCVRERASSDRRLGSGSHSSHSGL